MNNRDKIWILTILIGTPLLFILNRKGIINIGSKITVENITRRKRGLLLTSILPIITFFVIPDSVGVVVKILVVIIVIIACVLIQLYSMSKK